MAMSNVHCIFVSNVSFSHGYVVTGQGDHSYGQSRNCATLPYYSYTREGPHESEMFYNLSRNLI